MANRRHSKVTKLNPEIRKTVNALIVGGVTIEMIVAHLTELADQGVLALKDVPSKSSVGRYTKGFLARLERLDIAREQSRTIVDGAKGDGLVMAQAASELILDQIITILMPEDGKGISPKQVTSIAMAISKLQTSSASRERAKIDVRKDMALVAKQTAKEVGAMAKKGGLSKKAVDEIKTKILGIAS